MMSTIFQNLFFSAGGGVMAFAVLCAFGFLLSRIEVSKIKLNPWSAIRRWTGDFFGAEHMKEIAALKSELENIKQLLEAHVQESDRRNADNCRRRILSFERELGWNVQHTREDFEDIMAIVFQYENYCREHEAYKNHIAEHAIAHIGEEYDALLRKKERKHDE